MAKHRKGGDPIRGWIWIVIIVVGVALLLGWNPLGLDAWVWDW